jgi:hypothetical protein
MKTTIELPKELAEFEAIYRELLIKETLELVSDIRDEYNTLKQENPSKTLEISGYLIDKYNKSIIDEVIRFSEKDQYFIDKCTKQSLTLFSNLLNKVSAKVGNITDLSDLTTTSGNNEIVLNGVVTGQNGKVKVQSILAGGHGVQRLHIRTLIKEIK